MRKVVLDTETTGIHFGKPIYQDHYIIEVGAIELIDRKPGQTFQRYIRAPRESTPESLAVHGLTQDFLKNSPEFKEISHDLKNFIQGAELIIHNAPFDLAFLNAEFARQASSPNESSIKIQDLCTNVIDTLQLARKRFPNRKNSLDILCQRFNISNEHRLKHGALLDSELLLHVYLALTGGQKTFLFLSEGSQNSSGLSLYKDGASESPVEAGNTMDLPPLPLSLVQIASPQEVARHKECLEAIALISKNGLIRWD